MQNDNDARLTRILKRVRRIELLTRGMVKEMLGGQYHSRFKGQGIEFDDFREYQPGDDVRFIDWNVTARMNDPFVRKYVEEATPIVRERAQKAAPGVMGALLDERFTEDELKQLVAWLESLELPDDAVIALVCHMPIVGRLTSFLLTGSARHDVGFYLAEAKIIDSEALAPGLGKTVAQFVPPEHPV